MAERATEETKDWKADLEELIASSQHRDSGELFQEICRLAETVGDNVVEALLDAHPERFGYSPILAEADYQRTLRKDTQETDRLLGQVWETPVRFRDVASVLAIALYDRVSDMFDHVDFNDCRRAVMVGCGRLPATAFHIHDRTDTAEIIALDVVPESVEMANALARKLGYERMRAELRDGREYDYGEAQIIFVARMVSSKPAVLSRIVDTAPRDVQIVMRDPLSVGRLWTESGERGLDPRLEVVFRGPPGGFGSVSRTIYLKKRVGPSPKER